MINKFIYVLVFIVQILSSSAFATFGKKNVSIKQYLDMGKDIQGLAKLIIKKVDKKFYTGTACLIEIENPKLNGRVLITAAHVLRDMIEGKAYFISFKNLDLNIEETGIGERKIIDYYYPALEYDFASISNDDKNRDIALVLLDKAVPLKGFSLDLETHKGSFLNKEVKVFGTNNLFGNSGSNIIIENSCSNPKYFIKRGIQQVITSDKADVSTLSCVFSDEQNLLLAGMTYRGDSGGPMLYENKIIAVVANFVGLATKFNDFEVKEIDLLTDCGPYKVLDRFLDPAETVEIFGQKIDEIFKDSITEKPLLASKKMLMEFTSVIFFKDWLENIINKWTVQINI
jgi:hypothetical protein